MPSWAWVVTVLSLFFWNRRVVSMPSWAWVVTHFSCPHFSTQYCFNALMGLSCCAILRLHLLNAMLFQCPHGLELLLFWLCIMAWYFMFQCPHGLELLLFTSFLYLFTAVFQCPHGLELLHWFCKYSRNNLMCFNALMGLSCYSKNAQYFKFPMILFYAYLLFISIYYHTCQFFSTNYLSFWGANPLVLFWELAFRTTLLSFFW